MAEAVVLVAIKTIEELLSTEAKFLYGVSEEIKLLQVDLRKIQSFLKDAENKQERNEGIRNWVARVRDIAYEAEGVIETFVLNFASGQAGGISILRRFISMFMKTTDFHELGVPIKSLRAKIKSISGEMQTLGLIKLAGEGGSSQSMNEMQQARRSYPHDEEVYVISLETCMKDLMAQLLTDEDSLRVVSVVGMGGIGKTTLAKKVYNHMNVRRSFDCRCWVFISQNFSERDVLLEILRQLAPFKEDPETWDRMKEDELIRMVHDALNDKRYLVVLDDVWNNEVWDSLRHVFTAKEKKGSKILLTTRIKQVALLADPQSKPIEHPFLTNEESWTLFFKKAFATEDIEGYIVAPELEKLGKDMLKKCGGLPLAIVVLGGLLATKKSLHEWEVVQRTINAQFKELDRRQQYAGVYAILALSYHALPWYLKPCFLYFSQFPEEWEITKKALVRMWIAEGFILQSPNNNGDEGQETMEDAGERYLEELINRCMIQISQRDHTGMRVKTCRIHNLMRDVCVSQAREENFLGVIEHHESIQSPGFSSMLHTAARSRRIAAHCRKEQSLSYTVYFAPMVDGNPHLHSLFYFVDDKYGYKMTKQQHMLAFKNFRLLKVLNLENVRVESGKLSKEIGTLIFLRYLGLRSCRLRKIPSSIGNIRNLYTLDLGQCFIENFPDVLWKFKFLRHMIVSQFSEFIFTYCRVDTLEHLETLKRIEAKILIRNHALHKLKNLRNLGISIKTTEEAEEVLNSPIFTSGQIRSLNIGRHWREVCYQDMEPFSRCQKLTKLKLNGRILEDVRNNSVGHNLEFLPASLAKLTLSYSRLKQDPITILEKLPNLRFLSLEYLSYEGSEMVCHAHGLPKLEFLQLKLLEELEEWFIEEGSMPCLKTLIISGLNKMRMIPEGLKCVTTLQELTLWSQPQAFKRRAQILNGVEGEDFYKVCHVPTIRFEYVWR